MLRIPRRTFRANKAYRMYSGAARAQVLSGYHKWCVEQETDHLANVGITLLGDYSPEYRALEINLSKLFMRRAYLTGRLIQATLL